MTVPRNVHVGVLLLATAWCAGIVLAPLVPSSPVSEFLYSVFSRVCHQFPDRSFHFGGEPLGVCIRCTGIYSGFLLALAAYPLFSRRFVPTPRVLALFLLPMAADVVLRLTGIVQGWEETRIITGILCGLILPFFLMPPLAEAIRQVRSNRGGLTHARET